VIPNKHKHLTVGVLCQNGLPHLTRCLDSLPALTDCAPSVDFILVDSASTDDTLKEMRDFAASRNDTRIFRMQGKVNQSATRNVILEYARPGSVFLVDGDVEINREFVVEALNEIWSGMADIVYGQLPEIWHTADHVAYMDAPDRYKVSKKKYTHTFMGIALLGPRVLEGKYRYDEEMRRYEDFEFSIRMSDHFRILSLPRIMGTHYTIHYHSTDRIDDFYKYSYQRPAGQFIRNNIKHPKRLWKARDAYSGNLIGLTEQILLLLSLLSGKLLIIATVALLILIDISRFKIQGRLHRYIPMRIIGAWQLLSGFLKPEQQNLIYETTEVSIQR
jgi:glycosyltransferase involved in cell wall biosynthesis